MEGQIQDTQQRYFYEYQHQCVADINGMHAELARWEAAKDTILTMSLEEQATYGDYVTKKICANEAVEMVIAITTNMYATAPLVMNACAIGNMALLLQTVMTRSTDEQLKTRLFTEHQRLLASQKCLRAASGCKIH